MAEARTNDHKQVKNDTDLVCVKVYTVEILAGSWTFMPLIKNQTSQAVPKVDQLCLWSNYATKFLLHLLFAFSIFWYYHFHHFVVCARRRRPIVTADTLYFLFSSSYFTFSPKFVAAPLPLQ